MVNYNNENFTKTEKIHGDEMVDVNETFRERVIEKKINRKGKHTEKPLEPNYKDKNCKDLNDEQMIVVKDTNDNHEKEQVAEEKCLKLNENLLF